jgi:hypothetical protein
MTWRPKSRRTVKSFRKLDEAREYLLREQAPRVLVDLLDAVIRNLGQISTKLCPDFVMHWRVRDWDVEVMDMDPDEAGLPSPAPPYRSIDDA